MPPKNEQLIGAFASTLDWEQKLALLLTPNRYHEWSEERALAQYWYRRGWITERDYRMMVWEDPSYSLWAKYTRLGTVSWAKQVVEMGDVTALVAPASQVLGMEEGTNDPVLKADRGFPTHTLQQMLSRNDLRIMKGEPIPMPEYEALVSVTEKVTGARSGKPSGVGRTSASKARFVSEAAAEMDDVEKEHQETQARKRQALKALRGTRVL